MAKTVLKAYLIDQKCYCHFRQNAELVQTHLADSHLFDIFQKHNFMLDQLSSVFLQLSSGQDKHYSVCSD